MELESEYVLNIKKHITCKIQSHILSILSKDVQEKI